jgi:hypothetical protein
MTQKCPDTRFIYKASLPTPPNNIIPTFLSANQYIVFNKEGTVLLYNLGRRETEEQPPQALFFPRTVKLPRTLSK